MLHIYNDGKPKELYKKSDMERLPLYFNSLHEQDRREWYAQAKYYEDRIGGGNQFTYFYKIEELLYRTNKTK
jgi:hypothetical protein